MRQLTDGEMKTLEKGWLEHLGNRKPILTDFDTFEAGFIAALDHAAAQIAALTAERDGLREALKNMLFLFDQGFDKSDTLGRMRCDEARRALDT